MTIYYDEHRCQVCGEPLDTGDEKSTGVHQECAEDWQAWEAGKAEEARAAEEASQIEHALWGNKGQGNNSYAGLRGGIE